jgi:pyruvate dehydrogenase E1 component
MYYREDSKGQILQEGINEPGAMASFIAAATSYSTSNTPMIPFYIYYSMFGFQRVGDLAWAAGDIRARGFLIGGTSGRTTLNGEGLQHEDGHSHLLASTIPNCVGYDPTYAYELAVIVRAGLKRMYTDNEDVYYYITTLNENYAHPGMPEGVEEGILRGMYKLRAIEAKRGERRVRLLGSGAILREVEAGAQMLADDFGVSSEIWSVTSFTELRREGLDAERWSMLHPEQPRRLSYVEQSLAKGVGPVVAATDYMKAIPDGIRQFVPARYKTLGTDGFGRSDYRRRLRSFFEVDRRHVAVAALKALADDQMIPSKRVAEAIARYEIDPEGPNPARS